MARTAFTRLHATAAKREAEESSDAEQDEPEGGNKDEKDDADEEQGERKEDKDGKEGFKPSKKVLVIGGIVFWVIVVGVVLYWLHARQFVSTDDAYTTGHVHQISSRIMGTVIEVKVDDNQLVNTGEVLVRLDPRDNEVALEKANAGLLQAQAQAAQADAKITQAKAQESGANAVVNQAQAQMSERGAALEKAKRDYERNASIMKQDSKAISKMEFDASTAAFQQSQGAMEAAKANLTSSTAQAEAAKATLKAAEAEKQVASANVAASQAQVDDAKLQLSYCNVVSPSKGKVSKKTVEEGQRLQPGQALMAVVPDDIWVLANLKETQLERVRVGQRVDLKIDTLPHKTFYGKVDSVQEGSGATFSLLPPDNATGNFTKIVQRVPVKIVFDPESIRDFRDKIVPGLSVEPKIDLESLRDNRREAKRQEQQEKQNVAAERSR